MVASTLAKTYFSFASVSFDWNDDEARHEQFMYAQRALESEDRQEELPAFAEKRRPIWKGC